MFWINTFIDKILLTNTRILKHARIFFCRMNNYL